MSFVKKAVKKVFSKVKSFVKRLVKSKWFKIALVAAITVFTAGVGAAGGWAAFSAQAFSGGIGTFFSTVGSTMASGFSSIVASVKSLGSAAKGFLTGGGAQSGVAATEASLASAAQSTGVLASGATAGTSAMAGTAAGAAGVTLPTLTAGNVAAATATGASSIVTPLAGATAAKEGIVSRVLGGFMGDNVQGSMLRQGVVSAFQNHAKGKELDFEKKRWRMRNIAGGAAIGGEDTYDYDPLQLADETKDTSQMTKSGQMAQQEIVTPAQQQQQQAQGSTNPFLLDAPPAFQPAASEQDKQMALMQQPQGQQPPPATQPVDGRREQAPGLLSGNLGVA